ncbi:hypothetical protein LEMLEM_LOCUS23673, partial [Lemmus lemmus]
RQAFIPLSHTVYIALSRGGRGSKSRKLITIGVNIFRNIAENNRLFCSCFCSFSGQPTTKVQNRSSGGVKACPLGTQQ